MNEEVTYECHHGETIDCCPKCSGMIPAQRARRRRAIREAAEYVKAINTEDDDRWRRVRDLLLLLAKEAA